MFNESAAPPEADPDPLLGDELAAEAAAFRFLGLRALPLPLPAGAEFDAAFGVDDDDDADVLDVAPMSWS